MLENREQKIIDFLAQNGASSSKEIYLSVKTDSSYATIKRVLANLLSENYISSVGRGRGTRYKLSAIYECIYPINIETYFSKEIDEREIRQNFNFSILETLSNNTLFSKTELERLHTAQNIFRGNVSELSENEYRKEFERLAVDLSWKSSQIEGNTYSLLETERLLKEKETAAGKTKEEATMLLNHKDAIDFILEHPDYLHPLTVSKIEDIHSLLTKELSISRNIRERRVGISGTNYYPLDNHFQITEALSESCEIINKKKSVFEKALLALVLISYIQPFADGNKRTARIVSNAILMNQGCCPLSFRTVDSTDYKKAMLLFYEQNNVAAIKNIFIEQFEFAVKTYF